MLPLFLSQLLNINKTKDLTEKPKVDKLSKKKRKLVKPKVNQ